MASEEDSQGWEIEASNKNTQYDGESSSTYTWHDERPPWFIWNDKTFVLFDTYIKAIKSGEILQDNIFTLLEKCGCKIIEVKYQGVWLVVGNGYHDNHSA